MLLMKRAQEERRKGLSRLVEVFMILLLRFFFALPVLNLTGQPHIYTFLLVHQRIFAHFETWRLRLEISCLFFPQLFQRPNVGRRGSSNSCKLFIFYFDYAHF